MLRLYVLFTAALAALLHPPPQKDERGSVTIENVLWAVAVIAIVAIVVAAIRAYVTSESGKLQ